MNKACLIDALTKKVTESLFSKGGTTPILLIITLLLFTVLGVQSVNTSTDNVASQGSLKVTKSFFSARSGLAIARAKLWTDYVNSSMSDPLKPAGATGNMELYQGYLDRLGLIDSSGMYVETDVDLGNGQRVESIQVYRTDAPDGVVLTITSTGSAEGQSSSLVTEVIKVEGRNSIEIKRLDWQAR